jgi:hypothetical protein
MMFLFLQQKHHKQTNIIKCNKNITTYILLTECLKTLKDCKTKVKSNAPKKKIKKITFSQKELLIKIMKLQYSIFKKYVIIMNDKFKVINVFSIFSTNAV